MKCFKLLILLPFFTLSQPSLSQSCELFAPNSFTPNNDGYNDTWEVNIPDSCYFRYECKVYDKYGSIIWESYDATDKWVGSVVDGSHYVQNGVYHYIIIVSGESKLSRYVGSIKVIR
jgi:gliding motility-associated-like protein